MSSKRRRQTRRLRMDTPWDRQPWNHNEVMAIRRKLRRLGWAARLAGRSFDRLVLAVNSVGTAWHDYNQREK